MFNKILVVCTGNICRSPIAEGLLHARLPGKTVRSAGVAALIGAPADPTAVELMAENGHDISGHIAQQATLALMSAMDVVLTLDQTHSDWINRTYPQLRGRVHKLLKWRQDADVMDPYRRPREAFEQAYRDIDEGVADWVKRLK